VEGKKTETAWQTGFWIFFKLFKESKKPGLPREAGSCLNGFSIG